MSSPTRPVSEPHSVLTAAYVVCRECLGLRGVRVLDHVVRRIDGFMDSFSGPGAVTRACKQGASVRKLTYLAARDTESHWKEAASFAATCGHVHVLRWLSDLHSDRCEWGPAVMNGAALCGHLDVVRWLHQNRQEGCTVHAMDSAVRNSDFPMMEWLHAHRSEGCSRGAMDWAAAAGNLPLVQWLHTHRSEGCSTRAMDWAAAAGHLEVVQWLHDNRIEGDAGRALRAAASSGHLEVVQWLHAARGKEQRDDMDSQAALEIAETHNHVEVAEWLKVHQKRMLELADGFAAISNDIILTGCVGCIDGWLCDIRAPSTNEVPDVSSFFSGHYQKYGVNVQAICDSLSRFTAYCFNSPGKVGKSIAFSKWELSRAIMEMPAGFCIIRDNAYPLSDSLLVPFNKLEIKSKAHSDYNFYLSQLRIRIEMAFGLLVNKWQIFMRPLVVDFVNVKKVIKTCMKLHNFCIDKAPSTSAATSLHAVTIEYHSLPESWYRPTDNTAESDALRHDALGRILRGVVMHHIQNFDLRRPRAR